MAHLEASARRLYADRRASWVSTRMIVAAMSGQEIEDLPAYPDYEDSEEEYDAEAIEAELMASPFVIHVAAPPLEAQPQE